MPDPSLVRQIPAKNHSNERHSTARRELMELRLSHAAVSIALAIGSACAANGQSAVEQLQPLVEASGRRIAIAEEVALAKWDSGAPVEDTARESEVIASAVKAGQTKDLNPVAVSVFFKDQIEANKVVQYSLSADWRRAGKAPNHVPVNLTETVRPELDRLQSALIAALAETASVRGSSTCRSEVAKATGEYLSTLKTDRQDLYRIALDRALASACNPTWRASSH
jgi:chorismate mutase